MSRNVLPLGVVIACLGLPLSSLAAVTTISGGISTGYEYFDRQYDDSESTDDDDYSRFRVSPFITIVNETSRQSAEFRYAPSYWYDLDESEDDIDHTLSLDYMRLLTQHWSVTVADRLSITDEYNTYAPTTDPDSGDITSDRPGGDPAGDALRDDSGRRRYTNNTLNLGTSYIYAEDSAVGFDYAWTTLSNDDDTSGEDYQDYDKHDFGFTLGHRLNAQWKTSFMAGWTIGDYESVDNGSSSLIPADDDDVDEYRASFLADYLWSQLHTVSGYYGYNKSDYESNLRDDSEIHTMTLRWAWNVSERLRINAGGGPTYTKQDGSSGDWSTNAEFGLNYRLEKGSWAVKASHGTSFDNFSGTDDRGSSEFYRLQTNLQHALTEYLSMSAYASYSSEDRDEDLAGGGTDSVTTDTYALGCGFSYRFLEDYTAGLNYGFVHNTSDDDDDDYDDHRVVFSVAYENDWMRW